MPTPSASPPVALLLSGRGDHPSRSRETLHLLRAAVRVRDEEWRALAPWERYLARVHAAAARHPDIVFSHESAAALWGLPVFGEPRHVHCFDPDRATSTRRGDLVIHTSADPREITSHASGLHTTDAAHTTLDLLRVLPPAFALALMDAAISPRQLGLTDVVTVRSLLAAQRNRRGVSRAEWVLDAADPLAESVAESVSRAVITWLGFELPELQVAFRRQGGTDRVDFFWRRMAVIGEMDGYAKYAAESAQTVVDQVIQEKRREDRLREQVRGFVRWEWRDAIRAAPLREKLLRAGVPVAAAPARQLLATLRTSPRSLP
jgi:hypothetical protein